MSDLPTTETATAPLLLLRQAREASGLHIAALAAALKVPVKKLEALEAGRYHELPDMTFARALASSACRQLKVDPGPVLQQIPVAQGPQLGELPQSINTPFKGTGEALSFNPANWITRPAVLVAAAVLLAALALFLVPARESAQPEALMPPGAASTEAAPAEPVPVPAAPVAAEAAQPAPVAAPPAAAPAVLQEPQAVNPVSATATAVVTTPGLEATATTAVPSSSALLSIAVKGDSWVEVVNGKGGTVIQRMLKAGDVLDFSSAPPYSVVIGRADVAQVTVRGKVMDIAPYARNSVARFEVR